MSLDFALKDFYRNKTQTFPYLITIVLVIAVAEFFIYFSNSIGLSLFLKNSIFAPAGYNNEYFFSGSINLVYSQFNFLILMLLFCLTFFVVIIITTTLIISKKKDIATMKAVGTLPHRLYSFYMTESIIIYLVGFGLGIVLGLISFGIFALILFFLGFKVQLFIDVLYTPILFFSCLIGIVVITGYKVKKIGRQNIIKTFSKEIPYDFDASKDLKKVPKWLSKYGFNLKIALINTARRKGEYNRYLVIFSFIFLLIFTLGLGILVVNSSTREWINDSQGDHVLVFGHEDIVESYSQMYEMFSDPSINVSKDEINFLKSKYLFNYSAIDEIEQIKGVKIVDERLISFYDVLELDGILYFIGESEDRSGYIEVGQQRSSNIPIVGLDPEDIIQEFETEGRFFSSEDAYDNMTIGDGLAYNFFDYPLDQSMKVERLLQNFHISGVVIDSFYSGYAGYIGLDIAREKLNYTDEQVNVVLVQVEGDDINAVKEDIQALLEKKLGNDFTCESLDVIFEKNLNYLSYLSLYPLIIIVALSVIALLSLYNYQKAGFIEKAKDFLIMKAIGTKKKALKKIMFFEALFIEIPALLLSLGFGLLLNAVVLLERAHLPPLFVPFAVISALFAIVLALDYLSLVPISRKIDKFSIKDFGLY